MLYNIFSFVCQQQGLALVGKKVRKNFEPYGWHWGEITTYCCQNNTYLIVYDDEDSEIDCYDNIKQWLVDPKPPADKAEKRKQERRAQAANARPHVQPGLPPVRHVCNMPYPCTCMPACKEGKWQPQ